MTPKLLHHQKDHPNMGEAPPHPSLPYTLCSTSIDETKLGQNTAERGPEGSGQNLG